MVRTRIAPSPTGYPHIGTIYQALFNYAYAKKYNGTFIVRIEDTDRARFVQGTEEVIFQTLDWFGLIENESPRNEGKYGPYRQSERLEIYFKYAQELITNGHAYYSYFPKQDTGVKKDYKQGKIENDFVTDESPPQSIKEMIERQNWVVRMRVPKNESISFTDQIRGDITFPSSEVTEQVLIKSDGYPTYHLAVVVDDHLMKISNILRAEEWLSSTPKHVLLYKYLGWEMPPVYHTATLRNPDKSKLSKRHGHTNVLWFKEHGYLPDAILNYLALLGWSHPEEKEVFNLSEFINLFDIKDIRPVAPIFDITKLTWINQQYIQAKSDLELKKLIFAFDHNAAKLSNKTIDHLIPLLKSRMQTLSDFALLTEVFYAPHHIDLEATDLVVAKELLDKLMHISEWNHDMIFIVMKDLLNKYSIKMSVLYKILTGQPRGLPLPETVEILGKEVTRQRLFEAINK